jgi:hypothetical protein
LSFKNWTHIRTKHHCQLLNECHRKEEQIKNKIEKMKSEYRHQKTLLEEQTKGSGSTWSWFRRMTIIMEGFAKGDGALGGVDQGTMEIIEKVDHKIPNIKAFTPMLSNDEAVRDVPLPKTFVNTLEEGMNTFPLTLKSVSCKIA